MEYSVSTLKTNTIQAATGSTINIATGTNLSGAAGSIVAPGNIIQVESVNPAVANFNTTSTSFVTTGIAVSITPKFSTSKILISASFNSYKSTTNHIHFTIYKDSTNLGQSTYGMQEFSGLGAAGGVPINLQILNSPSTTSQVTYTVYVKVNNSDVYINSNSLVGNITAMEIAQ